MLNDQNRAHGVLSRMREFALSKRGVAGVEFAIVAPFLITLFLGTVEISRYLGVLKRVQNAASDIALAASASDEKVSGATLWALYGMVPVLIPDVITDMRLSGETDWSEQARMTITFVKANRRETENCGNWCKSNSRVLWSYGRDRKECGKNWDNSGKKSSGLPRIFWDEGTNFFAVEVNYSFEPLFVRFLSKKIEISEVAFAPPKYHSEIEIVQLGEADVRLANNCAKRGDV